MTFRLSEPEHTELKTACRLERYSMSAMARQSVLERTECKLRPKPDALLTNISEKLDVLIQILSAKPNGQ